MDESRNYSTLKLYQNTKFYAHQNYKIDSIEDFLDTLDTPLSYKVQYFKTLDIDKEIKIVCAQKDIKDLYKYNYARIEIFSYSEGETTSDWVLYYFVTKINWISSNAVKLTLRLDTLNSFLDRLNFSSRTLIEREHIDRWDYNGYKVENNKLTILRNIPYTNEGLNPQKFCKVFPNWDTESVQYTFSNKGVISNKDSYQDNTSYKGMALKDNTSYSWICITISDESAYIDSIWILDWSSSVNVFLKIGSETKRISSTSDMNFTSTKNLSIRKFPYPFSSAMLNMDVHTESNPFEESGIASPTQKEYDGKTIYGISVTRQRILSPDSTLNSVHYPKICEEKLFNVFKNVMNIIDIDTTTIKSTIKDNGVFTANGYSNESSLYSSEFLNITFYYDIYDFKVSLEDLEYNSNTSEYEKLLNYDSSISGRRYYTILFSPNLFLDNSMIFYFRRGELFNKDYSDIKNSDAMFVSLNNRLPIINSEYLNYLRNGYNYDVKIRDTTRAQRKYEWETNMYSRMGEGISINPFRLVRSMFDIGVKGFRQEQSETYNRMLEDLQMEKNISMIKGSRIGVDETGGGIDKTRLTYGIGTNRAYMNFTIDVPSEKFWKPISDYFYYYGNRIREYKIPTHNNRALFDYLKCEAEFINRNNAPSSEILTDIIDKLKNGTTFIHKYLNQFTFDYDYKENIENALLNIL